MGNMLTGRLFDIKKFSTHDGEGIRTTLFLKGCPMRCAWCQNPEGLSKESQLLYFKNRCIGCGICLRLGNDGRVHCDEGAFFFERGMRRDWSELIDACPTGALMMDCTNYTVDEVMEVIRQDLPFYHYGGGVTISGGEPLMQPEFSMAVLRACRAEGIHTAMETSLLAPPDVFKSIISCLDMVFADMKVFDCEQHRKYTGISNEGIKENMKWLLNSPIKGHVTVRTPLIPGFTDTIENIENIAKFISGAYSDVRYELLNYNPLAMSKYSLMGEEYCFEMNPRQFNKVEMDRFYRAAAAAGVITFVGD